MNRAAANNSGKRGRLLTQTSSHFRGFWRLRANTWPSHFTSFLFRAYRISPVLPSIPEKLSGKLNAKCRKSLKFYTELDSLRLSYPLPSLPSPSPLPILSESSRPENFAPVQCRQLSASFDSHFPSHLEVANPFTRNHRSRRRRKTRMTGFVGI